MIEASFEPAKSRSAAVSGAYQYDTGQRLRMLGLPSPEEFLEMDELLAEDSEMTVRVQFAFVGDSQTEERSAEYDGTAWVKLAATALPNHRAKVEDVDPTKMFAAVAETSGLIVSLQ